MYKYIRVFAHVYILLIKLERDISNIFIFYYTFVALHLAPLKFSNLAGKKIIS